MAFQDGISRTVLFGGAGVDGAALGDTWEWDGTSWTRSADFGATACVKGALAGGGGFVTLFGGASADAPTPTLFGTTWARDSKHWVLRQDFGPSPRRSHAMAFDLKRNALVLFGGLGQGSVAVGDTWEHVE
jgi:hypothetical protein